MAINRHAQSQRYCRPAGRRGRAVKPAPFASSLPQAYGRQRFAIIARMHGSPEVIAVRRPAAEQRCLLERSFKWFKLANCM
jgi:hypothetical protein